MRSAVFVAALALAVPSQAQTTSVVGNVSALADYLPNVPRPGDAPGTEPVMELRLRALLDAQVEARPWLRFRFAAVADGLVADRRGSVRDASFDALEAWVEFSGERADVRFGLGRIAWGRLDEVQPTDVINPIDVSRFLLEGRSEARIAVPFLRGRVLDSDAFSLEAVLVPAFRHGRFDRLDEESSPFNLIADASPSASLLPGFCGLTFPCVNEWSLDRTEPRGLQGGARASFSKARFDWSVSGWYGFLPFALVDSGDPRTGQLTLVHPRYTMFGADFETVRGKWAFRGEGAYFPFRPTQADPPLTTFRAHAVEAGAGVDRRAGDFTLSATVLLRIDQGRYRSPMWPAPRQSYRIVEESRNSLSVVGGFSRSFNRDRIETRVFSLVNPADGAGFVRGLFTWKPADDVAVETSVGWFIGDGDDVITQFGDRDFAYVRVKYYFGR